ncbi:uncharacterized protein BcabD6B2_11220 [Babesia caballi]|uniref:Transmembrane protein n=1 Tax=Babesia caballi TaxID=5871 RepID=A0AAV4LN81_BABCB|nr:transmembrane protein [Babesia caballi]
MFVIDPQTLGCCAVGCCAVAAANYVSNNLAKVPHPSECGCIGSIYRIAGIHTHDPFDVILEIHEAINGISAGTYYLEVEAGRNAYRTQKITTKDCHLRVHEKLKVHLRQCDDAIAIKLYKRNMVRSQICATLVLSAAGDLMAEKLARRRWFTMTHENRSVTRVKISIYRVSEDIAARELSALTLQAILEAQQDGSEIEEELLDELDGMDDCAKLRFFSKVISGPLKRMNTFGRKWSTYYFKPLEISAGNWEWCAWNSLDDYNIGLEAVEAYPLLAISVVVPDPTNASCFYVKYHKEGDEFGLLLKTVDRNRDVWSDSLYEFVERSREIYFKSPNNRRLKISHKSVKRSKDLESCYEQKSPEKDSSEPKVGSVESNRLMSPLKQGNECKESKLSKHIGVMAKQMYVDA